MARAKQIMAVTNKSKSATAVMPVHQDVFIALQYLDCALRRHYGEDFAYTVVAYGSIRAASNAVHGVITPRTE